MSGLPDPTTASGTPAAVPATIDPARFEDFEGFRETFLAVFTDPQANATLRGLGDLLFTMALEYTQHWPREPGGAFSHQVRAVLADLRQIEGWFRHLGQERTASALTALEERLSALCESFVPALRSIGDALEFEARGDPDIPPPLGAMAVLCKGLPWEEQRTAARQWILTQWIRGEGEGDGNARLLRELRDHADRAGAFGFYHILALEVLCLLGERSGKAPLAALGAEDLPDHLLSALDVPADAREHYTAALLR
jgi:hypothetical protein